MLLCSLPTEWPAEFWGALLVVIIAAWYRLSFYKKAKPGSSRPTTGRLTRRTTSWYKRD